MTPPRRRVSNQAHPRRSGPVPRQRRAVGGALLVGALALAALAASFGGFNRTPGGDASLPVGLGGTGQASGGAHGSPTDAASATGVHASGPSVPPTATPLPLGPGGSDRFGLGLLIADRGNGRLLIVNAAHKILWRFPAKGSLPPGQQFRADDAFIAPDGRTIVANDEFHQVIDRIDIVSRKIIWQYGNYNQLGSSNGGLHTPDDAYPLANGDVTVADIRNCRVLEINAAKQIVQRWGHTLSCGHNPPQTYDNPNGDTPMPDGGVLITEIGGSRVVRLDAQGTVMFDIHVPVAYPSDAQLDPSGNVIVVDYSTPGALLRVSPSGKVLWRYKPLDANAGLDHPSLAIVLSDGTIAVNDDFHHRVVIIDPTTNRIVWQYGRTAVPGRAAGYLNTPDGMDLIPSGTLLR